MYHDLPPPPPPPGPPVPIKLKPKTLKKLSQQAVRGPLYLIMPTRPHCGPPPPHPMHHPVRPPSQQSRNYAFANPRTPQRRIMGGSVGSMMSVCESVNGRSSTPSVMDSHYRFRPDKYHMRPRVQQFPWMHRSKSPGNWVRHLTSDDDLEEEDEDEHHRQGETGDNTETRVNMSGRPEYQASSARLVGEIQLSSRVASMTIADVSPRFALKVSLVTASVYFFPIQSKSFPLLIPIWMTFSIAVCFFYTVDCSPCFSILFLGNAIINFSSYSISCIY